MQSDKAAARTTMTTSTRILLVDGDKLMRRTLSEQLAGLGYEVVESDGDSNALSAVPDAEMLLVAGEPSGATGAELCRSWRERRSAAPILALVPDRAAEIAFKMAGADACLRKPVRLAQLAAALAALRPPIDAMASLGRFRFHPASRVLEDGSGQAIRLTEKEAAILAYLQGASGRVVPREELLDQVWGYAAAVTTHTLETHIYRLRRKLATGEGGSPLLVTELGGYRLAI